MTMSSTTTSELGARCILICLDGHCFIDSQSARRFCSRMLELSFFVYVLTSVLLLLHIAVVQ